jgi:hypothetical protein
MPPSFSNRSAMRFLIFRPAAVDWMLMRLLGRIFLYVFLREADAGAGQGRGGDFFSCRDLRAPVRDGRARTFVSKCSSRCCQARSTGKRHLVFGVLNGLLGISYSGYDVVLMIDGENLLTVHSDPHVCLIF